MRYKSALPGWQTGDGQHKIFRRHSHLKSRDRFETCLYTLRHDYVRNVPDADWGFSAESNVHRLSENAKFKKSGIDIKGLMTLKFAKIPILGQPVQI